jgi:hypothetical protein
MYFTLAAVERQKYSSLKKSLEKEGEGEGEGDTPRGLYRADDPPPPFWISGQSLLCELNLL